MVTSPAMPLSSDINPAIRGSPRLLRRGGQPEDAAVTDPLTGPIAIAEGLPDRFGHPAVGSGLARRTLVLNQTGEVIAHPVRPLNWARWVNSCSSTHVAELLWIEAETLLEPSEVRADHVHRIVDVVSPEQQVVLAEHPNCSSSRQMPSSTPANCPLMLAATPFIETFLDH